MKITKINREQVLELFFVDSSSPTGLRWNISYREHKRGDVAGVFSESNQENYDGMWKVHFMNISLLASRVAWTIEMGDIPDGMIVDHRDGNPLNNSVSNLCLKTMAQNIRARSKKNRNNTSGFHGVSWSNGMRKWRGRIFRFGKERTIGYFDKKEDAALAVDVALRKWAEENGEECRLQNIKN